MEFNPSVTQKHLLFSLLFTGEEPAMSKTIPSLNVRQRKELAAEGFIELEKRGRTSHIILTDRAWAWAFENFGEEVPGNLKLNAKALEGLLKRLKTYMVKNGVALAELLLEDRIEEGQVEEGQVEEDRIEEDQEELLYARVRSAYYELAGFEWNVRVRIADLRNCLLNLNHDDLSELLRKMQLSHRLVLYPLDDPRERRPEDIAAAVDIAGQENHIIYMGE